MIVGLFFGLLFGLLFGLSSSDIDNKNFPNQGIWNSFYNGLLFSLPFALMLVLNAGLNRGLIFGLISGLIGVMMFGLIRGLNSVMMHIILRFFLYQNGDIPWNYAKFLDHAAKHRFIQRVGGRYRFMHDLLRKHFAQMPLS